MARRKPLPPRPREVSNDFELPRKGKVVKIVCKKCAKRYATYPDLLCEPTLKPVLEPNLEPDLKKYTRCTMCKDTGEKCILINNDDMTRLSHVQHLAREYLRWKARPENRMGFAATDASPRPGSALQKDSAGVFIFPGNTPQEYVDLWYAQYYLSRNMKGGIRDERK